MYVANCLRASGSSSIANTLIMILSFWFVGRKPQRNVEPYKICIFSVVDVERVVVAVDEVETLARVGQPYTAVLLGALLVFEFSQVNSNRPPATCVVMWMKLRC